MVCFVVKTRWKKNQRKGLWWVCAVQVDRDPILFVDYFVLTIRIWCPSRRPAFSASDPVLTELIKLPLSLPPTRVISDLRLSPFRVTRWIAWQEFLMRSTDVTEGRKGLCSWKEVTVRQLSQLLTITPELNDKWETYKQNSSDIKH